MKLTWDAWQGISFSEEVVDGAGWEDVCNAICRLDETTYSSVFLEATGGTTFVVAGGNGRFIAYVAEAELELWSLTASAPPEVASVRLCIGGQEGDFPGETVLPEEAVLSAVAYFLAQGTRDPSCNWLKA